MGIKSFQGKHVGITTSENITVKDFMHKDVYVFHKGQPILKVIDEMVRNRISGGPVINEKEELIGIISEGDCIKQLSESRYYNQPIENVLVDDYMVHKVETVNPDMNLFEVANKFLTERKRKFPVCDERGRLIGLISQKNVLETALKLHGVNWK
ncbi:CBS domain-containing protein [Mesonia sp. K7]|uniref:CBS domain-containing protein n=1 Tax=Mesonia sp. K7 TaxID=2218606 RepID=UPI000DA85E30|nr:CBS domain-containing protein [Mesonia sp. K7]PZD78999.1 inosine-5-monophosphate dehydrogenase [Mesonia sp. K7]